MRSQTSRSMPLQLSVGLRCWLECDGQVLLGRGRAELLDGIDRFRSISAAARSMKMSYRRAWLLVKSMNDAAGEPIVETAIGGQRGGGATLTQRGREALAAFRKLDRDLREAAEKSLPELVKSNNVPTSKVKTNKPSSAAARAARKASRPATAKRPRQSR